MNIAIISDTHGNENRTQAAIREIERHQPRLVIHCGDIGSVGIVWLFCGRPTHFVIGNVDDPGSTRVAITQAGLHYEGLFADLTVEGMRIGVTHGHDQELLRSACDSQEFDLICTGHTHQRQWTMQGRTRVLNPGAIHRTTEPGLAFVRLPEMEVGYVSIPGSPA